MTSPKTRVGVIGLGLGSMMTVPWMLADDRFSVQAAVDTRPEARKEFERATGGTAYDQVDKMWARTDIDLVYVATPHYLHADHALAAIEAGKHVLVEKPLERTAERAAAIADAAESAGTWAFYGHSHASDPIVGRMAEMVTSGQFGSLGLILNFNYNDMLYRPRAEWELDPDRSGGSPWIQGAHQIDICRFVAGAEVVNVSGWSRMMDTNRMVAGTHTALLQFETGAAASIVFSGYGHFDSAEWNEWIAETGVPRDPDTHATTNLGYERRLAGAEHEADFRDRRRVGFRALEPSQGLEALETFGITIATCDEADLRSGPWGVIIDSRGARRVENVPMVSGRQVILDQIHQTLSSDIAPELDCRWAVESVRVAEQMEACK